MEVRNPRLKTLENESITIIREATAECERPALLFSGGKDSAVVLHLASKAFAPGTPPFPLVHIDTGHNFPEVMAFRDATVAATGMRLVVGSVQEAIDEGRVAEPGGSAPSRNQLQTESLLHLITKLGFDVLFGGARRDEEGSRSKERVFSHRDEFGQWHPQNQRPELWSTFNTRKHPGEHFRVFPISDWTEQDVWEYCLDQAIELPSIYFAHSRQVIERNGFLVAVSDHLPAQEGDEVIELQVRFRTVGDMTCTAAIRSDARTASEVLSELETTTLSERGATRMDDRVSDSAMEDRKRLGYF